MSRLPFATAAGTALAGTALAVALWPDAIAASSLWSVAWPLTAGLGCAVSGHVLVVHDRRRASGYLLLGAALCLYATAYLIGADQHDVARGLWAAAVLVAIPPALLMVFRPHGTRWFDAAAAVAGLAAAVAFGFGVPLAGLLPVLAAVVMTAVAAGVRFEHSAGDDRRRVLWVILGLLLPLPSLAVPLLPTTGAAGVVLAVLAALLSMAPSVSAAIAVVAPRIVDVRALIERLTVGTVMAAFTAAAYMGTEAVIAAVTGSLPPHGVQVLIVVGVAAAFHPVLRWVRASVREMLFGGRADPVQALAMLGTRLAANTSPPDWIDTLRVALAAPGVAVRDGEHVIAASGDLGDAPTARADLRTGTAHVGELVVALATDDPHLARATEAVLDLVSVPLAQALYAARLTEDLRESRSRAVSALEEERRRLRRDLHDGLGPMLTGITYSADAVANLLHSQPAEALEITQALRAEAGAAIAEIRRIVYGLRPSALDELGLIGAVQQQAARLRTPDGRFLTIIFDAPDDLSGLPAAVEVTAYRMVVEALTNVARHSGRAEAAAAFRVTDGNLLRIKVSDRGRSAEPWVPGVGIASMRERVELVGGALTLCADGDGATVTAEIPLPGSRPFE